MDECYPCFLCPFYEAFLWHCCIFFVVHKVHVWLRACYSSLYHSTVSTRHRCCSCRPPFHSATFLSIFRMNIRQCLLPSISCNQTLLFEDVSQSSKISVIFMSAMRSCDSLLNSLISFVCLKSWRKDSLFGWFSNFSINCLTLSLRCVSCCSTAERGTPGIL